MAAGDTTTVRVRRPDAERLSALAAQRQVTVIDVVHAAIEALERQDFLHGMNEDYLALQSDPDRWEAYQAERAEWEALG